jgi:hypothetical protein
MITLTNPVAIRTVLGSNVSVNYDRMVLTPINLDPVTKLVGATIRITSTTQPANTPLVGTLQIGETGLLVIDLERAGIYRTLQLTAGQRTSVGNIIAAAQNSLEQGLIDLAVVAGTQAPGV